MIKKSATIPLQYDTGFSPFYASEFDQGLEWVKGNGFEGVELVIAEPVKVDIDCLTKKLSRFGLKVSTIATGQSAVLEGLSFTDNSSQIRERTVIRVKEHIELSEKIGYPNVTIGLLRGKDKREKLEDMLRLFSEGFIKCIEYATKKNIILNLEPINRYETGLFNGCEETLDYIMSGLGNPENVGVLYDTFHSNIEDRDMIKTIETLGRKISHIHFADSNRHLPGEGHIDFKAIYNKLVEIGYNGYISLETLNRPDREMIRSFAGASMKAVMG